MSKSKYESGMKYSVIVKWVYVIFKHKNDDGMMKLQVQYIVFDGLY